ncbi:MAG: hypothetical protein Q8M03_08590 [Legionella sp.]|nr:hypothetical protein [Legionella sp.]
MEKLAPALGKKLETVHKQEAYDPKFPYSDLYTQFFSVLENNIDTLFDEERARLIEKRAHIAASKNFLELNSGNRDYVGLLNEAKRVASPQNEQEIYDKLTKLDHFIFSVYANENGILEHTFNAIQQIPMEHTPIAVDIEKGISSLLKDSGEAVNIETQSPAQAGSAYGRFTAMIADDFKPQHTTSLATRRTYDYNKNSTLKEYRFGTQGQRDKGIERVSPLFERWLRVQEGAPSTNPYQDNSKITHVYINNLGLDRKDMEGTKERALSKTLHELENRHSNIAVITLPADKGLMHQSEFIKTNDSHSYQKVYNEFLQIAAEDPAAERVEKDFYISSKIRKEIFKDGRGFYDKESEKAHLSRLLKASFKALGIKSNRDLSSAERQAVWFHFIKFELPNHIIKTLEPQSINFSCKDAIDRGGVSSAYYNLMKSIEEQHPLSREEFERALHAAPAMVKARGMNHHLKLIWNAIDVYINANDNYEKLKGNPEQAWIIQWRDANCPHARVEALLALRIQQVKKELDIAKHNPAFDDYRKKAIEKGVQIINLVEEQSNIKVSGQRLLLETVTRTSDLVFKNPTKADTENYNILAEKLSIKYPALQVLGGLMKSLAGIILLIPTLGRTKEWINKGIATTKAALQSETRAEMLKNMEHFKSELKEIKKMDEPENNDDSLKI